jgi:hypothetical protein
MDSSAMAGADPNYKESETPESDILAMQDMKDIKGLYNIYKTYNKNIFPIRVSISMVLMTLVLLCVEK